MLPATAVNKGSTLTCFARCLEGVSRVWESCSLTLLVGHLNTSRNPLPFVWWCAIRITSRMYWTWITIKEKKLRWNGIRILTHTSLLITSRNIHAKFEEIRTVRLVVTALCTKIRNDECLIFNRTSIRSINKFNKWICIPSSTGRNVYSLFRCD